MRIGVNCFPLQRNIGGLRQKFLLLFDWLLENDSNNQYIFFYFSHNVPELEHLRSSRWREKAVRLDEQEGVRSYYHKLDLYYCPLGPLWPRPVPLPSVMTLADIQEEFYPQFFSAEDRFNRAYHFAGSTRAADRVITISEYSKNTIARVHRINQDRIVVAHLCADPAYERAASVARPLAEPMPAGEYLIYPANRWLHKNHDALLRAMVWLKGRGLRVNCVFTGMGVSGGYPLSEKAREFGLGEQVFLTGYVGIEQMAYLYLNAKMLVFPSLFEGFGMPPVEAMTVGCPALVSNATCLPEICGDAALYFDPTSPTQIAETIERAWHDASLRESLVRKGRERSRHFSAINVAKMHLSAFREAQAAFSPVRYRWQKFVYQPWHRYRVFLQHRTRHALRSMVRSDNTSVEFASGWYPPEQDGGAVIRWTNGRGRLIVRSPRVVRMKMSGAMASVCRPNTVEVIVNRKTEAEWVITGENFYFEPVPPLTIDIRSGRNVIEFLSSAAASTEADRRRLGVAFRGLTLEDCGHL